MLRKMSKIILGLTVLLSMTVIASAADFTLKVGNKYFDVSTNNESTITLDNKVYKVKLNEKSVQNFKSKFVSFDYIKDVKPSKQDLSADLTQIMMATPLGSIILIQEYQMNISSKQLYPMMKHELSKQNPPGVVNTEDVKITKILKDGTKIHGIHYTTKQENTGKLGFDYKIFHQSDLKGTVLIMQMKQNMDSLIDDKYVSKSFKTFWDSYKFNN